ncbi:MAG: 5-formyltetrahydrofolate cyclo-ligase [Proteobacteria bacterium]|nr:5-formyltetrahydrofolate cyclo-ligase [Pseudomonadota bacterium]
MEERLKREKQTLRQSAQRIRAEHSRHGARRQALSAADHLVHLIATRCMKTVAMYAAQGDELNPQEAVRQLRHREITLCFPRVIPGQRALAFYRVDDLSALEPGSFGIPEPNPSAEIIPLDQIDLFVVPGLAFDRNGQRLGWGKGHYDATLAESRGLRVGYCYEFQLVEHVPTTEHDMGMDALVTDIGVLHVSDPHATDTVSKAATNRESPGAPPGGCRDDDPGIADTTDDTLQPT